MIAILLCAFFAAVALFAIASLVFTERHHAGAWDELAEERRRLRARAELDVAAGWPSTISTRAPAEPSGPVAYQRRFTQRAAGVPLQPSLRAA